MAYYLVKAKAQGDLIELKKQLDSEQIVVMRPFGTALDYSLKNARVDSNGFAIWEEEDYCSPPLAMERAAVLDSYFTELTTERVQREAGWERISSLPILWENLELLK